MTAWVVLLEVEADRDTVNDLRVMLQDLLELTTDSRPRTWTITRSAFNAALHPPKQTLQRRELEVAPLWEGPVLR